MKNSIRVKLFLLSLILISGFEKKPIPTLYLIGDSTVKNGSGKGEGGLWGWGDFLYERLDTSQVHIENLARGGRSSRTYQTEGLWDKVLANIKSGDYVLMQFGHNDRSPVNDTLRARGTIKGTGEETQEIDNLITKKHEIVHSYGWYMRKYIQDAKAKGGIPIVCSPVARNVWKDGKIEGTMDNYATWAREVAAAEAVSFIDLNALVARRYEQLGQTEVKSKLFLKDDTHTTEAGAKINAGLVAGGIKKQKLPLKKFLKKSA